MTGKSWHTKYRPTTLSEVYGQRHILPAIKAALDDRSQQAFLLSGPSGTGKTTLARICAAELGCDEVIEVDAASNSGVDAMRGIADHQNYRSLTGGGYAFIIDECHRLSRNAWDALLKSIEEPPEGVYWFFATTEPTKVPKTVNTRCMSFALADVPWRDLLGLLDTIAEKEGLTIPEDVLAVAATEAAGSPRAAIVNLATVRDCANEVDAMRALDKVAASKEAIDLARMLAGSWNMGDAVALLKSLKDVSPESIRMTVYHYTLAVALNKPNPYTLVVLNEFSQPAIEANKVGDILLRVGRINKIKGNL